MDRYIEVTLRKRGVSCIARMLDDLAPKTCEAVWNALPQHYLLIARTFLILVIRLARHTMSHTNR